MEIHGSRGAPLNDYYVGLQKKVTFSSSYASVTLRGILQENIDEAPKKNNFQKKVYQKIFIFEEIDHFLEQKIQLLPKDAGNFQ